MIVETTEEAECWTNEATDWYSLAITEPALKVEVGKTADSSKPLEDVSEIPCTACTGDHDIRVRTGVYANNMLETGYPKTSIHDHIDGWSCSCPKPIE